MENELEVCLRDLFGSGQMYSFPCGFDKFLEIDHLSCCPRLTDG